MSINQSNSSIRLADIFVRPITAEEISRWNKLMDQYHYLGFKSLIGETLRYVAEHNGRWIGLIGWGSAALHCRDRDRWIGWSELLKYQRLRLIANNVRFLILPDCHQKNLASKILSLNLKRLSGDWQRYHGHRIACVETFVEQERFQGTCYKAANWICIGQTQGYRKSGSRYIYHGCIKSVWVKPLIKNVQSLLIKPLLPKQWEQAMIKKPLNPKQLESLRKMLFGLPDPRGAKGRCHKYQTIIAIAVCAILSGAKSYIAIGEWAQACTQSQLKRLGAYYDLKKKKFLAPTESCIRKVLQASDAREIDFRIGKWLLEMTRNSVPVIAIDGKTLRGTSTNNTEQIHLLSAFLHDQGVVIGQVQINHHPEEPKMLKELIAPLEIKDAVITADALHTKSTTADYIVSKKKPTMF